MTDDNLSNFDVRFPPREAVADVLDNMARRVRAGQIDTTQLMLFSAGTRQFDFVMRGIVNGGTLIT